MGLEERSLFQAETFVRDGVIGQGERRVGPHPSSTVMGVLFTMRHGSGGVLEKSVPGGVRQCPEGHAEVAHPVRAGALNERR